jgi:hypothetical protein
MMRRRNLLKGLVLFAARRSGAQEVPAEEMRELAAVVLPASLGTAGTDRVADQFLQWIRDYREGVNMASGYGHPRTQIVPPNPSKNYAAQLRELGLAKLDAAARRGTVEAALTAAKIERIPARPDGRHVAADLLAFYFGSSAGEDLLYDAAIRRDACRGLENSGERPGGVGLRPAQPREVRPNGAE